MVGVYQIIRLLIYLFLSIVISKFIQTSKALAEDVVAYTVQVAHFYQQSYSNGTVPILSDPCKGSMFISGDPSSDVALIFND